MSKRDLRHAALNEIVRRISPESEDVDDRALFHFMFHTNRVPSEIVGESERVLTELMQDEKEWIWVEMDASKASKQNKQKKILGALGFNRENPDEFTMVDLLKVQKSWRSAACDGHPLDPIIEFWLNCGQEEEQEKSKELVR